LEAWLDAGGQADESGPPLVVFYFSVYHKNAGETFVNKSFPRPSSKNFRCQDS
jgi:hypothetical protein